MDTFKEADYSGVNCDMVIDCLFTATATGDGHWGMEAGTVVTFTKLELRLTAYNDDGGTTRYGELCAYHNKEAHEHGLCYTDKGVTAGVMGFVLKHPTLSKLVEDGSGSEQGMQEAKMFSLDVQLTKKYTIDELVALGMGNVEEWD